MRGAEGDVAIPKGFRHPETRDVPENPGDCHTVCATLRNGIKTLNNNLRNERGVYYGRNRSKEENVIRHQALR